MAAGSQTFGLCVISMFTGSYLQLRDHRYVK